MIRRQSPTDWQALCSAETGCSIVLVQIMTAIVLLIICGHRHMLAAIIKPSGWEAAALVT